MLVKVLGRKGVMGLDRGKVEEVIKGGKGTELARVRIGGKHIIEFES